MKQIRVLVADKQALTLAGIESMLENEEFLQVIGAADDRETLNQRIRNESPDIVVLDYATIENFSATDCALLHTQYPSLKLFILTANSNREQMLQVLQADVFAFLTKDCSQKEILHAFRAVSEGQKFYCNSVLNILTEYTQKTHEEKNAPTSLSPRELQIVSCIAQDLSTQDIAAELNLSPHTINAHRKRILKKLNVKSPVGLVMKALRLQLIQLQEPT
ncbi:MAG: response regulator transcription factor [Cyclobacteriaceae bacterium]